MSTDTEHRVQRVINGLLPSTALIDRFGPPNNLSQRMEYFNTPGVSIAVIDDFKVDWIQGFGVCDVSSNQPVTGETLFQAGSISKAIFAVAVMRLVQDGVLDLDVDVNQYLTSWQVPGNDQWQAKVTMRDLLSHTAGMNVHGFPGYLPSEAVPSVPQILNGQPPANSPRVEVNILPGTQFRYSGGGYVVAQQVVVDLLGKPFAQVMDELVFRTLRLTHSTYAQPLDERWAPNRATAHASKSMPVAGGAHIYPELAAAGLWSTAGDLAKVGVELLEIFAERTSSAFLSADLLTAILAPPLGRQKTDKGDYVGLGLFCEGHDEGFYFGHSGRNKGFIADMRLYGRTGKGAVVMVNSDEGSPLVAEILRAVATEYHWPDFFPRKKKPIYIEPLQYYEGLYATDYGMRFIISAAETHLLLHLNDQAPLPIFPSSTTNFYATVLNSSVRFQIEEGKGVTGLCLLQPGCKILAKKVD